MDGFVGAVEWDTSGNTYIAGCKADEIVTEKAAPPTMKGRVNATVSGHTIKSRMNLVGKVSPDMFLRAISGALAGSGLQTHRLEIVEVKHLLHATVTLPFSEDEFTGNGNGMLALRMAICRMLDLNETEVEITHDAGSTRRVLQSKGTISVIYNVRFDNITSSLMSSSEYVGHLAHQFNQAATGLNSTLPTIGSSNMTTTIPGASIVSSLLACRGPHKCNFVFRNSFALPIHYQD
jgi:hypothetical protein